MCFCKACRAQLSRQDTGAVAEATHIARGQFNSTQGAIAFAGTSAAAPLRSIFQLRSAPSLWASMHLLGKGGVSHKPCQ